jgi:hypothetical protein
MSLGESEECNPITLVYGNMSPLAMIPGYLTRR